MSVTEDTWTAETVTATKAKDAGSPHAWFDSMYYSRDELLAVVAELGLTSAIQSVAATSIHPRLAAIREVWTSVAEVHSRTGRWSEPYLLRLRSLLT